MATSDQGAAGSGEPGDLGNQHRQFSDEQLQELRLIRRLQMMVGMIIQVIYEDPRITIEEAAEMAAKAKEAALNMFPDKELAYDLLFRPRVQRAIHERFRVQ